MPKPHVLYSHPRPYERLRHGIFTSRSAAVEYALFTLQLPHNMFTVKRITQRTPQQLHLFTKNNNT